MRKQHLAILSDNKPGVLTHIAGLISRKAINIESLTVGYTEEPDVSRFNIVISIEDDKELKQTISQLANLFHAKVVDVNLNSLILRVTGREDHVNALIKVLSPYEILEIARTGTISLSRGLVPVKAM
mgnify:CR=1 FL=1